MKERENEKMERKEKINGGENRDPEKNRKKWGKRKA